MAKDMLCETTINLGMSVLVFFSPIGKFLADNIVGSVVVFSLLFWIPLSILVHCVVSKVNF